MDDKDIIKLYFDRNEAAIKETDLKYRPYCFKISNNILADFQSAEDCVNDTYLTTWRRIPPQNPNVFKLFLAKITRNLSLDSYRKNHAEKRGGGQMPLILDELDEAIPSAYDLEEELIYRDLLRLLNDFVKNLSDEDKTIFLQRYFYAMSIKEIALNSKYKYNNLVTKLNRLRKNLKDSLESEEPLWIRIIKKIKIPKFSLRLWAI